MGLSHTFLRISPEVFRNVSAAFAESPQDAREALALAARFGRSLSEDDRELIEEGYQMDLDAGIAYAFEHLVTEKTYSIDKAWRLFLEPVCVRTPAMKSVVRLFRHEGGDIALPRFWKIDAGLSMIWSHDILAEASSALLAIPDTEALRSAAGQPQFSGFDRMLGRPGRFARAANEITGEYSSNAWKELCAAVQDAVSNRHYLGLSEGF